MHLSNPWVRVAVAMVSFFVLGVAWWLISPLFIDQTVDEGFPTLAYMPTKTSRAATANALSQEAPTTPEPTAAGEQSGILDEAMPASAGTTLRVVGDFYDVAHHGEGSASVYSLADGRRILRLQDFYVLNGPDLHVYLAPLDPVPNTVGEELAGYVDLGALKGNEGNQNYEIPDTVDLDVFKSVVIWCVPFRVPFSAAALQLP